MRKRFETQLTLGQIPIEKVKIPNKMRDEMPPILAGLQWIYTTPEINEQVFEVLEKKITAGKQKTGRTGMDLWHILVLGVVRLGLGCDLDRLEYLVRYDRLFREIMGLDIQFDMATEKGFHQKTISQNIGYIDEETLIEINQIIAKAGHALLKKKRKRSKPKLIRMF